MHKFISLIFSLFLVANTFSQNKIGNWLFFLGNKKITEKVNWHHEIQYRNYTFTGDLEQLLLRTGVGYNLNTNHNLLLGYGFIRSENYINSSDDKMVVNEHRIFQQYILKHQIKRLYFSHRFRLEERFIEANFKTRFRYFISLNVPLNQTQLQSNTFYLSGYNEIFLHPETNVFDRNRAYGGIGYKFGDLIKIELGYMNQLIGDISRDQIVTTVFLNW